MAEVGPNIGATITLGADSRADAARADRREAAREEVRAEARANFDQASRMVADYVNRTSMPRTREDFHQIRQFVRSFYTEQQLNSREVDLMMLRLFPDVDPSIMGVTNPEPAPNPPNPAGDGRTDANPNNPDPRDARPDAGADRFVKNPNPANPPAVARPAVAKDAPPPPPPGSPPPPPPGSPPPPPPGSPPPPPGTPLAKGSGTVVATDVPTDNPTPLVPGTPAVPGSPVVAGDGAEPPPPVRMFSLGHSFGPGRDAPPDVIEHGLTMQHTWSAFQSRGGNMAGTPVPVPVPTAVAGGETLLGRLARSRTSGSSSGRGSSSDGDGRTEGLDGALSRGVYRQLGFRRA